MYKRQLKEIRNTLGITSEKASNIYKLLTSDLSQSKKHVRRGAKSGTLKKKQLSVTIPPLQYQSSSVSQTRSIKTKDLVRQCQKIIRDTSSRESAIQKILQIRGIRLTKIQATKLYDATQSNDN